MKRISIDIFVFILYAFVIASCSVTDNTVDEKSTNIFEIETLRSISEESIPNLIVKEGHVSQKADTFRVIRNDQTIGVIILSEPTLISQAENEENWGYYQFPKIYRSYNGYLIVKWQMKKDSSSAYGGEGYARMMSRDEGKTWEELDQNYFPIEHHRVDLLDGNVLQIETPKSQGTNSYTEFPVPVNNYPIDGYDFYYEAELPEDLRGVYLTLWNRNTNHAKQIHGKIEDPKYLRYSLNGSVPIVWWGDLIEIAKNTFVAGVYPCFYQNSKGQVLKSAVSFYRSDDGGYNWQKLGIIPFQPECETNYENQYFDGSDGFTEPAFVILKDNTYLCVMRSSSTTPMYKSFSEDYGKNWSKPEPFTPNGVLPRLALLDSGVLALASGRPGLQLRFNMDGDGEKWTEPIEMMPFMDENGNYNIWTIGCGYPDIMKIGEDAFYIVYSDFRVKNQKGEQRKTIFFRKIEILKR